MFCLELFSNIFDTNDDLTLFNSPLSATIGDVSIQTNSINDPLSSLFSPSSLIFNLPSPITPFLNSLSNNDQIQDISYSPITTQNTFP